MESDPNEKESDPNDTEFDPGERDADPNEKKCEPGDEENDPKGLVLLKVHSLAVELKNPCHSVSFANSICYETMP